MPRSRAQQIGVKFPKTIRVPNGKLLTIFPFGSAKGTVPDIDITEPRVWHIVFNRDLGLYEYARQPVVVVDPASRDALAAGLADAIAKAVVEELGDRRSVRDPTRCRA